MLAPTKGLSRCVPAGGLVGVAGYDLVRYFERLPNKAKLVDPTPDAHYLAPRSLLVFDHLTRGVALLHAGSEAERESILRYGGRMFAAQMRTTTDTYSHVMPALGRDAADRMGRALWDPPAP